MVFGSSNGPQEALWPCSGTTSKFPTQGIKKILISLIGAHCHRDTESVAQHIRYLTNKGGIPVINEHGGKGTDNRFEAGNDAPFDALQECPRCGAPGESFSFWSDSDDTTWEEPEREEVEEMEEDDGDDDGDDEDEELEEYVNEEDDEDEY